jgi:hypothetical protein
MLNKEDFAKRIKVITQDAWQHETNTTVNSICEYIVRETTSLLLDELDIIRSRLADFDDFNERLLELEVTKLEKDHADASKDGGLSQPKRSTKASNASTRNAESRESSAVNA